jgi:hypothetical protein
MGPRGIHPLVARRDGFHPVGELSLYDFVNRGILPTNLDIIVIDILADNYSAISKLIKSHIPTIIRHYHDQPHPPGPSTPTPLLPPVTPASGLAHSWETSVLDQIMDPKTPLDNHDLMLAGEKLLAALVEKYLPLTGLKARRNVMVLDGHFSVAKEKELKKRGKTLWGKQRRSLAKKAKITRLTEELEAQEEDWSDVVSWKFKKIQRAQNDVDRLTKNAFKWSIELALFLVYVESQSNILKNAGFELEIAAAEADTRINALARQFPQSHLVLSRDGDLPFCYMDVLKTLRQGNY